ncbi:MAG: hypothetical protein AAFU38_14390 [Bacteroidota bacterium]
MSEWKDQKRVVLPLAVLAVAVWAYVLYILVGALQTSEAVTQVTSQQASQHTVVAAHVWQDDFRDPFGGTGRPEASAAPNRVQQIEAVVPEPIALRFIGVVDGTAMLERPDGSVVLAQRGTEIEGGRVTSVTPEAVVVRIQGLTQTLPLE